MMYDKAPEELRPEDIGRAIRVHAEGGIAREITLEGYSLHVTRPSIFLRISQYALGNMEHTPRARCYVYSDLGETYRLVSWDYSYSPTTKTKENDR